MVIQQVDCKSKGGMMASRPFALFSENAIRCHKWQGSSLSRRKFKWS